MKKKILIGVLVVLFLIGIASHGNNQDVDSIDNSVPESTPTSGIVVTTKTPKPTSTPTPDLTPTEVVEKNETPLETDIQKNTGIRAENLKGRGYSDSGRSEPQYINIIGYVVIPYGDSSLTRSDTFVETPWSVSTYEQDKQFWVENGVVDHKTEVIVKSQQLEHVGYGAYSGYLLVERIDNGEQFYISVKNFITKPYWTYEDLEAASLVGYYIAEYNQISDYYPVTKDNDKVELDNSTKVLVTGRTGLYGRGGPDSNTHSIEAIVFKEWKYGYGGVSVFFNQNDLSIIY